MSETTVTLDLRDPTLGVATGPASCTTSSDGTYAVRSDPVQGLAGTSVYYYLGGDPAGDSSAHFEMFAGADAGEGPAELVKIRRAADAPGDGGLAGPVPDAISGLMTWTCEPPRGEPTPIEGSWFN